MKTFPLKISSPNGDLFNSPVTKISLRGIEGDFMIMAGHIPFVTPVVPCNCKIELEDGSEKLATTDGGILTVSADKVTFLSGTFKWN